MFSKLSHLSRVFVIIVCVLHTSWAKSGYFWHVTDFHYDPTYWTSQLSCNDPVPQPGMFGDYWCDSNWLLVKDSIANMAAIKSDVNFVIWTGDSVAHLSDNDTSITLNTDILQNITDVFSQHFDNNVAFLPSLGNHDFHPSDQADVKEDEIYNRTAEIWKDWITDKDELEQYVKGGFYTMLVMPAIRLMSVNTNLYYNHNRITKSMEDPAGQFVWMEKVLEQARTNKEKVIVTAHVTPGLLTPNFVAWMYPEHHKRYVGILTQFHDVIITSHYGHDHSDGFKIVQEEGNDAKSVTQFVAPSVTPWRFRAGTLTGKAHNPGIRLVEFNTTTGQHLNYVQYYINLTDTNANKMSNWTKLYDFRETYQVPDMSVESLRSIFSRMAKEDDVGKGLAQTYCNNALVSEEDKECTRKNQFEIVCGGKFYDLTKANKCVKDFMAPGGTSSHIGIHFACIILSVLLTLVVFFD